MQNVLEQGPNFWCWFNKTRFSYHCVHPIHVRMFSIQILLHFSQIVPRVYTLVLFIFIARLRGALLDQNVRLIYIYIYIYIDRERERERERESYR